MTEEKNKKRNIPKELLIGAASSFAMKLLLEKQLKPGLSQFFETYEREVFNFYAKNGILRFPFGQKETIEEILFSHYKNVSERFKDVLRDTIGVPVNNNAVDQALNSSINFAGRKQAHDSGNSIISTTEKETRKSLKLSEAFFASLGFLASRKQISIKARGIFRNFWKNRIDTIALTETQTAAETTKIDEVNSMIFANAQFQDGSFFNDKVIRKVWVAILDSKTREWHVDADGQTVDLDEPFIVHGEELLHPSDDSLGASPENIINCRCSAQVEII